MLRLGLIEQWTGVFSGFLKCLRLPCLFAYLTMRCYHIKIPMAFLVFLRWWAYTLLAGVRWASHLSI